MRDIPQDASGANRLPGVGTADEIFARRLRALRETAELTQRQLAEQMTAEGYRMHQTTIAKIEAGERPVLVGEAVAFARIIGASLPDLVTDPAGPDLVDAIVARDKWVRRKNELDIMASHASTQLDTIQAERHAVSLELARASERVQELHDAGFQRATSQGK